MDYMLQFCLAIFMIPAYYINDPIIKDIRILFFKVAIACSKISIPFLGCNLPKYSKW